MTEQQWVACAGPATMLRSLQSKASGRKLRLFACACVRRVWSLLDRDDEARAVVETVEQYADGLVGKGAFDALLGASVSTGSAKGATGAEPLAVAIARSCASTAAWHVGLSAYRVEDRALVTGRAALLKAATSAAKHAALAAGVSAVAVGGLAKATKGEVQRRTTHAERAAQGRLLRDLFGNPFRAAPAVDPSVLACNNGVVVKLARASYDDRQLPSGELDPDRLAVLADALEEAGAGAELPAHLRGRGPHVRGCWCVDLLLGKA